MRQYKILTNTTATTVEEQIAERSKTFTDLRVEGFAFDGTNYVALVSYEIHEEEPR